MNQPTHNPNKDVEVVQPPSDGISSLSFSPKSNLLVAGSWDNQVRCWEVQQSGATVPKASISHDQPVLCTCWSSDGTKVFSGSCDKTAKMWQLGGSGPVQVAQHDAPIKSICWAEGANFQCVVTGSWDKTVKYWDTRSPTPGFVAQIPDRIYAMDVLFPLLVVATAERQVIVYDVHKPTVEFKRIASPLKLQSRCIACFPDKTGFAIGSIEGRVGIHHIDDKQSEKNFAFKCHRDGNEIYPVDSIVFHPQYGTFATTGSDGSFNFWDKDSKQRLKPFPRANAPIPTSCFNFDGTIFAYAVSYNWFKGADFYNPSTMKNYILLHPTPEGEIKPRAGTIRKNAR
mmetsp:Transcript_15201/g.25043  ORF Transcript_15201/g.25043 Transcript_15201/m.25043 type:complete len:342 (+) Transcript_15201:190-1215(+)|eukprot:CAMPEP_0184675870 /NCGR_PEP_ID=MMETSP0308-20130426/88045_1 /TAXON_ID=38269 /ORGANISM="Gloeochaete witrockiana, Strain SAG 46.84" /LENGTH=341 /DNA_ID=CAMNT_0027123653 /DNA_START=103 /DNA_END=1128 /DNA_ORIENTATION=+